MSHLFVRRSSFVPPPALCPPDLTPIYEVLPDTKWAPEELILRSLLHSHLARPSSVTKHELSAKSVHQALVILVSTGLVESMDALDCEELPEAELELYDRHIAVLAEFEQVRARLVASERDNRDYLGALEAIQRGEGRTCQGYELCGHTGCDSSYHAWKIADDTLRRVSTGR